jgi:hypothetical protein
MYIFRARRANSKIDLQGGIVMRASHRAAVGVAETVPDGTGVGVGSFASGAM